MNKINIYQIDAFTDTLFKGNPAAVCIFDSWPEDKLMQNIAAENNLAETAFLVKNSNGYSIRWFTPTIEVDLCGHASLAAAYVIFKILGLNDETLILESKNSGKLKVLKNGNLFTLDFPRDNISSTEIPAGLTQALGISNVTDIVKGKTDYLVILENEEQVRDLKPDMFNLNKIKARGIIVSAKGRDVDFVSRFFGPQVGVPEDPVTGSAHTTLTPYWSEKLNKHELSAYQLSPRGGKLHCKLEGDRVLISGNAQLYLEGQIYIS